MFIELSKVGGEKVTINVNQIVHLTAFRPTTNTDTLTKICWAHGDGSDLFLESYEEVKSLLERATSNDVQYLHKSHSSHPV
ncbi:MAG: hypothetical protein JWP57_2018 [Spirosoma sp.]|nr:hypothetical protein [Spirosoma sp.]